MTTACYRVRVSLFVVMHHAIITAVDSSTEDPNLLYYQTPLGASYSNWNIIASRSDTNNSFILI